MPRNGSTDLWRNKDNFFADHHMKPAVSLAITPAENWLQSERTDIDSELSHPVSITRPPCQSIPLIFCSPHSGRVYTRAFLAASRLDALTLRRSEDAFVDDLFATAATHGAPLLAANFPRAYLDVNREHNELDPRLIEGALPQGANTQSARVAGGLGTIPRLVADGEDIYPGRLPVDVALLRIDRLYHPFHAALAGLIADAYRQFGVVVLVDCHSMPSATSGPAPSNRPQFVIGDRFGTSCAPELTRTVTRMLSKAGCDVQINKPYAGGFITEHYGRPHKRIHAIQIEINRALYLDENTLQRSANFSACAEIVDGLIRTIAATAEAWRGPYRVAAE